MRQVSLRSFRLQIDAYTEPVEVLRRDKGGSLSVLGYWTPYATAQAEPELKSLEPEFRPVRAVPKPKRRLG